MNLHSVSVEVDGRRIHEDVPESASMHVMEFHQLESLRRRVRVVRGAHRGEQRGARLAQLVQQVDEELAGRR